MTRATFFALPLAMLLLAAPAGADRLPSLDEKRWIGCYLGYEAREFEWAFRTDGTSTLYLKEDRERVQKFNSYQVRYILEEEIKGKWVSRKIDEEGFSFDQGASTEVEKNTVTCSYSGDTKVSLTHEFGEREVRLKGQIVAKETENPVRFGIEFVMPYVWRPRSGDETSERALKDKKWLEDAEVRAVRAKDGKNVRVRFWEDEDLTGEDYLAAGATEISIESPYFGEGKVVLRPEPDTPPLTTEQHGALYSGLRVFWFPAGDKLKEATLTIAVE